MAIANTILGVIGNVAALAMFASPIPVINHIRDTESVHNYSVLPYLTAEFSSLFGIIYSLGAVTGGKTNYLLLVVSAMGAVFYGYYIYVFIRYSQGLCRRVTIGISALSAIVTVALFIIPGRIIHSDAKRRNTIGYSMMAASIIANAAAPFKVWVTVVSTKTIDGVLPYWPTVAGLVSAAVWTMYSWIGGVVIFILVPNSLGFGVNLLVLGTFYYFQCFGVAPAAEANIANNPAIDMEVEANAANGNNGIPPAEEQPNNPGIEMVQLEEIAVAE